MTADSLMILLKKTRFHFFDVIGQPFTEGKKCQ